MKVSTDASSLALRRRSTTGARPRVVATYPTVRQPDTVAVAPGGHTLWVTGTAGDEVERISR